MGPDEIIDLLKLVLEHSYFRFGSKLYEQVHGIPMGTQCGAQLANLHCFYYELRHMDHLLNTLEDARTLQAFRNQLDAGNTEEGELPSGRNLYWAPTHDDSFPCMITLVNLENETRIACNRRTLADAWTSADG